MRERWRRMLQRVGQVPWIDHHLRAWDRANGLRYTRWAAAMALFGYLAVFPLLVLAFIVFGLVLARAPELRSSVKSFLTDALPLLFDPQGEQEPVDIAEVARATASAGIVAVIALLYAGLGWVDATVEGVRRMQGALRRPHHFLLLKVQDAVTLVVMGSALLVALVGVVGVEALGTQALDWLGWSQERSWLLQLLSVVLSVLLLMLSVGAFYAFAWWQRPTRRWRVVLTGALLASLVLVAMLRLSFLIVGRTLSNPVYGTLALAAALLLFLYFASAVVLFGACWVAIGEGAAVTAEEVTYRERMGEGAAVLPTVTGASRPPGDATSTRSRRAAPGRRPPTP